MHQKTLSRLQYNARPVVRLAENEAARKMLDQEPGRDFLRQVPQLLFQDARRDPRLRESARRTRCLKTRPPKLNFQYTDERAALARVGVFIRSAISGATLGRERRLFKGWTSPVDVPQTFGHQAGSGSREGRPEMSQQPSHTVARDLPDAEETQYVVDAVCMEVPVAPQRPAELHQYHII